MVVRCLAALATLLAFVSPASSQEKVFQQWTFDEGELEGWVTSPENGTGVGWKTDATPAQIMGTATYKSPPNSLNYNNGTNYKSWGFNNGSAMTPPIALTQKRQPRLRFWCSYQTESTGIEYDRRYVVISNDNFTTLVHGVQCASAGMEGPSRCEPMGTWHEHTIPLDPAWGTVKIRFTFSANASQNEFAGWFIDDIRMIESLPAAASVSESGDPAVLQEWTFKDGLEGWKATPKKNNVGWDADAQPSILPGNIPSTVSAPNSLNYNNGTDYDSGGRNFGTASSPAIDLTGIKNPKLKFSCNYSTEEEDIYYDKRLVGISNNDFKSYLFYFGLATKSASPATKCSQMGTWHTHEVALDPAWGTIQIAFTFDTFDYPEYVMSGETSNDHAGWFIDDVKITATGGTVVAGKAAPKRPQGTPDKSPRSALGCSASSARGSAPIAWLALVSGLLLMVYSWKGWIPRVPIIW